MMKSASRLAMIGLTLLLPAAASAQDDPASAPAAAVAPESEAPPASEAAPAAPPPAETKTASATAGMIPPPPEGKGQIVFFRKGGFVGAAISCAVHEAGVKISSLPPGRYVVLPAEPGIHNYSVKSEATDTLRIEIEPGETYYAKCAIGMGIMAGRPNLSPADEPAFAALSAKLKPVAEKK